MRSARHRGKKSQRIWSCRHPRRHVHLWHVLRLRCSWHSGWHHKAAVTLIRLPNKIAKESLLLWPRVRSWRRQETQLCLFPRGADNLVCKRVDRVSEETLGREESGTNKPSKRTGMQPSWRMLPRPSNMCTSRKPASPVCRTRVQLRTLNTLYLIWSSWKPSGIISSTS